MRKAKRASKKILLFACLFAAAGVVALYAVHASTPVNNAIEPESGSLSGNVTPSQDSNASGSSYVSFFAPVQTCPAGQVGTPPNCTTPAGTVILDEEFSGTSVDTTKWTMYNRMGDADSGQQFCYVPANTIVSGGTAKIITKRENHVCGDTTTGPPNPRTMPYTVGNLTQATTPFLYGTIDVRAKIPRGKGLWPLIWMLGYLWQPSGPYTSNTPEHNWPHDGWAETDIAEFWQGARTTVNNTIHYQTPGGLNIHTLPFDATTRFMVYRLIWSAGSAIWQVDGEDGAGFRTLYTVTGSANVPNVPMYISLDIAIGGPGADPIDPATFPQTMEIDYVRVTQ